MVNSCVIKVSPEAKKKLEGLKIIEKEPIGDVLDRELGIDGEKKSV